MKTNNIIIICSIVIALLGLIIYAYKRYKTKLSDEKPQSKFTTNSTVVSTNKSYYGGRRHMKNRKKTKYKLA